MKFRFKNFQFDCEQQLLTQDKSVLTLNEKPAQLLTLFLQDVDKIHKKSEILDYVWQDRVVTDQVVFQNISYLRSLFGSDAIKTFTRKGYQWQIPIELVEDDEKSPNNEVESTIPIKGKPLQLELDKSIGSDKNHLQIRSWPKKVTTSFIVLFLLIISWLWLSQTTIAPTKTADTNHPSAIENEIYAITHEDQQLKQKSLTGMVSNQSLFDSPNSTWQRNTSSKNQLLVAIKFYSVQDKIALRFHIQGEKHGWYDYILAVNKEQALNELSNLLSLLVASNYFSTLSNNQLLAKLTLLISEHPTHELLNQQLIKLTFKSNDLDRATALIDQQLAAKPSLLRQGLSKLLKTDITMRNKHWSVAKQNIEQALTIFKQLNMTQLESRALIMSSWGYLADKEFRIGMQSLNQAASKARESGEPLLEVNAHIIQSFIASKAGQMELAHTQVDLAKEIINLHQLSDEHQALIENNLGWISASSLDALQHYQNILNMPFSPQYESVFYNASAHVRNAYSKRQDWHKALASIKHWQRPSFQALNRAHISYAQGHYSEGLKYGKEAFQEAQVEHQRIDALDAALLILQNESAKNSPLDTNQFDVFIKQNSTRIWLDQNGAALAKLNKESD
jgi:DNA-binding winged helix-turn-helix (wHTH) protein